MMKHNWMTSGKGQRLRTLAYVWLLLGMIAMLTVSSLAWFSISPNPRVSDMGMFVNSPTGLQLAKDYSVPDEQWGQNISFPELVSDSSPLRPVTWSQQDGCFKAIRYGTDGRQSTKLKPLNDLENANQTGDSQYYTVGVFYARTDTKCAVSLADAVELNNGTHGAGTYVIGMPVWNEELGLHEDAGDGAQYAVRIGFLTTKIDTETGEAVGESVFSIYEPNADRHLNKTEQVVDTRSSDGAKTLVSRDRLLVQSTSTWAEADPVQRDVTVKSLGTFLTEASLFELEPGDTVRIAMYIWIEGQDLDCYGLPEDASLFANIQFKTDYESQSGLEEIPKDEIRDTPVVNPSDEPSDELRDEPGTEETNTN